ncbi:MAG: class I SAM-dependent methyltransferase [Dehalococcoidia bacterium]
MENTSGYDQRPLAEFYDHVGPYIQRADIEFYVGLPRESGGPVLELGCGTGRVLIPTARAGVTITGVDLSDQMLDACRRKLTQEPTEVQARVDLIQGDICDFKLGRKFKLVTIPFRPFQHLITVEDQLACLACVHRHLEPEGRFVLDVFNPDIGLLTPRKEEGGEQSFRMPDGREVVRTFRNASVDLHRQVIDAELIYYVSHPDGGQERRVHSFPMRYFFRFELEHLLLRAGFQVEALYGDFDRSEYGSKYPGELIFIACKA